MSRDSNAPKFSTALGLTRRLRLFFAMVKIQGAPSMRRHISVHRATTKYFSNSFVFKTEIEKEGLPRDSTPDLETSAQSLVGKLAHLPREQGSVVRLKLLLSSYRNGSAAGIRSET
jgi:hypothetical protein